MLRAHFLSASEVARNTTPSSTEFHVLFRLRKQHQNERRKTGETPGWEVRKTRSQLSRACGAFGEGRSNKLCCANLLSVSLSVTASTRTHYPTEATALRIEISTRAKKSRTRQSWSRRKRAKANNQIKWINANRCENCKRINVEKRTRHTSAETRQINPVEEQSN